MSHRLIVTGGLGFVGSAVIELLAKSDHEVIVFDDLSKGSIDNAPKAANIRIRTGDIRRLTSIDAVLGSEAVDAVIHLAATHFIPECNSNPQAAILNNVIGTENVLQAASSGKVPKVIAVSSMAVYPISERPATESDPVQPYDVYGETKVMNEMQLRRWSRQEPNRTAVAVRLSNVYGPRETNPHVIPEIMRQLVGGASHLSLGDISPYRDYIFSKDVASALLALLNAPLTAGFHVFNIGSGVEHSVAQIVAMLSEYLGRPIAIHRDPSRVRANDRMHLLPDITKMMQATSWLPSISFEEGLQELCRQYGLLGESGARGMDAPQ